MQIDLIIKKDQQTNTWSGGTTTQLAIYPKGSSYKNLDFTFRISTATIDVEQSDFTSLPDVSRLIMVLKGDLTIQHKNQYTKHLKKFDTDSFSGNWETNSIGKVTDFNVMTKGKTKATLRGFSLQENITKEFLLDGNVITIYISAGEVVLKDVILRSGDMILIYPEYTNEKCLLQAINKSDIAITQIYL